MSEHESVDILKQQLAKLERTVRWMKRCLICGAVCAVTVFATGAVEQADNEIVIKEPNGAPRVLMGHNKNNPEAAMIVYDENGKRRISMQYGANGPALVFFGPDGQPVRRIGPMGPDL